VGKCDGQTVLMLDVKSFHRQGPYRVETVKDPSWKVTDMTHGSRVPRPRTRSADSRPGDGALMDALSS
jgi:hypothetical protein